MAILPVVRFPDHRLKEKSSFVESITPEINSFLDDLVQTMQSYPGCVGLAAVQVGCLVQAIAVDVSRYRKPVSGHGLQVLLNPCLVNGNDASIFREGCLSVSDYTGNVSRFQKVMIEAMGRDGRKIQIETEGFEAIVFQHEMDHLNGVLFLDRVSSLKTDVFRRKSYLH